MNCPLVSIGLPVYNGENYIRTAIESVLAQNYEQFELLIFDNASTDRTEDIVREFVERDSRVHYWRQLSNLGAVPNFNATFHEAKGRYFKWFAHDDILAPHYLRQCVDVLESDPTVALCHSWVEIIDTEGHVSERRAPYLPQADSSRLDKRIGAIMHNDRECYDIFGVIRHEILEQTGLFEPYIASDRVLRLKIGLRGRYHEISNFLTQIRDHPTRSTRAMSAHHQRAKWFHTQNRETMIFPHWRIFREYARSLVADPTARRSPACWWQLMLWLFYSWNWARMIADLIIGVFPGSWETLMRIGQRLGAS